MYKPKRLGTRQSLGAFANSNRHKSSEIIKFTLEKSTLLFQLLCFQTHINSLNVCMAKNNMDIFHYVELTPLDIFINPLSGNEPM
jgi:hypothetical protein